MPVAGIVGAAAASTSRSAEPLALMFASGTMVLVVCTELMPRLFNGGHAGEHGHVQSQGSSSGSGSGRGSGRGEYGSP